MLESFLSLSPAALFAVSVLVPNLVAVPIVLAVLNRKISSSEGDATMLGPAVGFIGTSFSLLLTLLMVSIWSDQTASQQVLFEEMTTIQSILIQARSIAPERAVALKTSALKYVDLIRARELDETPAVCQRRLGLDRLRGWEPHHGRESSDIRRSCAGRSAVRAPNKKRCPSARRSTSTAIESTALSMRSRRSLSQLSAS